MPRFMASGEEDFNLKPETRLDFLELLCSKILLKCKRDRASDIDLRSWQKECPFQVFSKALHTCSVQFSSVAQSCPTLCDPMNWSTPGFPVHHQLLEYTQTHVHWVGDAIKPSYLLSSPSPPAFILSQHLGLFKWVSSSHQVAKYWSISFNISPSNEHPGLIFFKMNWLDLLAVQGSLESSPKPQLKSINSSALSFPYSPTLTSIHDHWKNHSLD